VLRVETLVGGQLLHTSLPFASEPEELAELIRGLVGEPLAEGHDDERGVFLIPSIAAPKAKSYDAVIEEVGEGGVWAPWQAATAQGMPDLSSMLSGMLGGLAGSPAFAAAAAQLQSDPNALREASQALPGLLNDPAQLSELMNQARAHMPELGEMLRGMGVDFGSPQLQDMAKGLQGELARDPGRLAELAEQLLTQGADDDDGDEDDEDDDEGDDDEPESKR
jgi:hypothetical protein